MSGGKTFGWTVLGIAGDPLYRIRRFSLLQRGEVFQESSAASVMSVMNLLSHGNNQATACAIYADWVHPGTVAAVQAHLDDVAWKLLRQAFESGVYVVVSAVRKPGVYTDDTNEVAAKRTKPDLQELVVVLRANWSDLTEAGARTLAAQYGHETGFGANCYNWNLGNVKEPDPCKPHMYLKDVPEPLPPGVAARAIARDPDHASYRRSGQASGFGARPPTVTVVIFQPPNSAARFHAYSSLAEGAEFWVRRQRRIAGRHPEYLAALNRGDTHTMALVLKAEKYYGDDPEIYGNGLASAAKEVNRELGPIR